MNDIGLDPHSQKPSRATSEAPTIQPIVLPTLLASPFHCCNNFNNVSV
jgi:hypothetical protein